MKTENLLIIINQLSKFIFSLKIQPEYIFDYLIQNILSPIIRHKSGEYYTPPFLVKKMVEEEYVLGEKVLDPCCGLGNFLVELVKRILFQDKPIREKISAINNIYGYDINPISLFISKIKILFLLKEIPNIKPKIYLFDTLFQTGEILNEKFDLVIGNPPWYTYRDIESKLYQKQIKNLAEKLEIKPHPKNILNLEVSTLFFYNANKVFMKNNAKIFFVITKGVITGSHTSQFRNFKGFYKLKIWTFDKKIEKIFNVDFICLFARKSENEFKYYDKEIPALHFNIDNKFNKINYFSNLGLKQERINYLIPYCFETKGEKRYTKKFILKEEYKELFPLRPSYYKSQFHKGADLNPRNLIFVKYKRINNALVKINPDERIFKRAKFPWNKNEFSNETVEKEYIFKVIKSTELVKFLVFNYYYVFLPLFKNDLRFNYSSLSKNAKIFYDKINQVYLKYKKETTMNNSLMDNLNRWSKLINKRQLSNIKVIYNNSGSVLNSAVVQGDFIITGDLSFYSTKDLDEAYFLSAILNSEIYTKQIQIMKSSRHIFKIPFDLPIPKFDPFKENHQKLIELGKLGETIAKNTISKFLRNNKNISKIKIQNILNKKLNFVFAQTDKILKNEIKT
ncbi:MAG: class I SAM-dependent DNA methyltransferase [Promethearchaeota archaeon]